MPPDKAGTDLRGRGLRSTVPRLKILAVLENSKVRHMSAEDVYRKLLDAKEEVGIATVYRVLTQFEQAGLVIRHHFESGRAVYELNDEAQHEHLICSDCDRVAEFKDARLVRRLEEIAKDAGFSMQHHALYLYGLCASCRKSRKEKKDRASKTLTGSR